MRDSDSSKHDMRITELEEKIDALLDMAKKNQRAVECIKTNATEITEMITIWRHGRATFWTFYTAGKLTIFIGSVIGAIALVISAFKIGGK